MKLTDRHVVCDGLFAPSNEKSQRVATFALIGTLLTAVAALLKCVGSYQVAQVMKQVSFKGEPTQQATKEMLILVTSGLGKAGEMLGLANLVLLIGGALVTYALGTGSFRQRWFFWSTLAFSLFFVWQPFVGMFFGGWWICLLIVKRSEFFAKQAILISA